MKHTVCFALVILTAAACDNKTTPSVNQNANTGSTTSAVITPPSPLKPATPPDSSYKSCNPYYPLVPGSKASYTLQYSTGLVAEVEVVVDRGEQDGILIERQQTVDVSGGSQKLSTGAREYRCDGERIVIVAETEKNKAEALESDNVIKFSDRACVILAPGDLKSGATWSYHLTQSFRAPGMPPIDLEPATRSLEYKGEEEVVVPAGTFKTVKVAWKFREKTGADYYAKGIGLVKRVSDDGTRWELKEYSGLKPLG